MLDFLPREQTLWFCFLCMIGYGIIYFIFRPAMKYPYSVKKGWYFFGCILILVLLLFYISISDWFAYYKEYLDASAGGITHMETFYDWLAYTIAPNYLIWRLCVWGTALFFLLLTFKQFPIPKDLSILVFVVFALLRFAYTRTALVYSVLFFGSALLYSPHKYKLLSNIIAIACIGVSFFLHKTAMIGIAIVVLSFVIKKVNWKVGILFVLIFPLLLLILRGFIANYMIMDVGNEDGEYYSYLSNGQQYLHSFRGRNSIGETIHNILARIPLIIMGGVCLTQCNNTKHPKQISLFMRISSFIVIASLICRLNLGAQTYILYYRLLNYSIIPIGICYSYLYMNGYYPKLLKIVYYTLLLASVFELFYAVYDRYVNGSISWL